MRITIFGGGNIGTQFAVHCAKKGHDVTVYTSVPDIFGKKLEIVNDEGMATLTGDIVGATNDPKQAFGNAEVIFVTVPANMMRKAGTTIFQYAGKDTYIGVVPGNGGGECAFRECIDRGNVFFGIERVPAIARLVKKGHSVKSTGYRNELHVSALPFKNTEACCELVEEIFDIPCKGIRGYLNLTMTPSNPILHTSRLRILFDNYTEGVKYNRIPMFYEEWDDKSSELLFKCDDEVQEICRSLPEFDLSYVKSLKEHYESPTPELMSGKIRSINAFKGIKTPMVKVNNGYIPDLNSRYFIADFSYGLSIIKQIGDFASVSIPNIKEILLWYDKIALRKEVFKFKEYGICSYKNFLDFYLQ